MQNAGNVVLYDGLTQRSRGTTCEATFVATKATLFYRLKTDPKIVVPVLILLSFGGCVQAIVQAFGLDARTVRSW